MVSGKLFFLKNCVHTIAGQVEIILMLCNLCSDLLYKIGKCNIDTILLCTVIYIIRIDQISPIDPIRSFIVIFFSFLGSNPGSLLHYPVMQVNTSPLIWNTSPDYTCICLS